MCPFTSSHFSSHPSSFSYLPLSAENIWAHEQRYLSVKFTFYHTIYSVPSSLLQLYVQLTIMIYVYIFYFFSSFIKFILLCLHLVFTRFDNIKQC